MAELTVSLQVSTPAPQPVLARTGFGTEPLLALSLTLVAVGTLLTRVGRKGARA